MCRQASQNKDCTLSEVGNDYFLRGPVDVYDFKAVTNKTCGSYLCGSVKEMAHIIDDDASASASTYPVGGYWGIVGRD